MDFEIIFTFLIVSWYVIFICLFLHTYKYVHQKAKRKRNYQEKRPAALLPCDLSKLLYNRVVYETFTSTIMVLISKNVLIPFNLNNNYYIKLNKDKKIVLSLSERYIIDLLINIIGDKDKVSLKQINDFCTNSANCNIFDMNYQIWVKMAVREASINNFYEQKNHYFEIKAFKQIGIILFLINLFTFKLIIGYYIIIPAIFILFLYKRTFRRKESAELIYQDWMAHKRYIEKNKPIEKTNKNIMYTPILRIKNLKEFDNFTYNLNKVIVRAIELSQRYRKGRKI